MLDDIPRRAEDDGRQTIRLKVSSDQTHGLVADRSECDKKHGIDGIHAALIKDCRGIVVDGLTLAEVCWDAVESRRKTIDATGSRVLLKAVNRQERLDITRVRGLFVP